MSHRTSVGNGGGDCEESDQPMNTALKVGSKRRKKLGRRMHRIFANSPPSILTAINQATNDRLLALDDAKQTIAPAPTP